MNSGKKILPSFIRVGLKKKKFFETFVRYFAKNE